MPFHHWLDDPEIHTIVLHTIRHTKHSIPVPRWQNLARGIAIGHQLVTDHLNQHRMELAKLKGKRVIECVTETDHPKLWNRHRQALVESGRIAGRQVAETFRSVKEVATRDLPD